MKFIRFNTIAIATLVLLSIFPVTCKAEHSRFAEMQMQNEPIKDWNYITIVELSNVQMKQAARQGNLQAMRIVANSHEYGINGFKKDYSKALYWYKKLLATDIKEEGYMGLASLYANGKGVEKNRYLAKNNFKQAVKNYLHKRSGHNRAKLQGIIFAFSDILLDDDSMYSGIRRKAEKGNFWEMYGIYKGYYQLLINAGLVGSLNKLTMKLTENQKKHIGKQIKYWANLGYENGNSYIMLDYAGSLLEGVYPYGKNVNKGIKLLKEIAQKCDTSDYATRISAENIGNFYGPDGQFRDYIESYKWYNISSYMGSKYLDNKISKLESHMSPQQIEQAQKESKQWINRYCN